MSDTVSTPEAVTLADIVKAVRDIAQERPERIYESPRGESCSYVRSGDIPTEGCGVGVALIRIGAYTRAELYAFETANAETTFLDLARWMGLDSNAPDALWIQDFQGSQDAGFSWERSVSRADDFASLNV